VPCPRAVPSGPGFQSTPAAPRLPGPNGPAVPAGGRGRLRRCRAFADSVPGRGRTARVSVHLGSCKARWAAPGEGRETMRTRRIRNRRPARSTRYRDDLDLRTPSGRRLPF